MNYIRQLNAFYDWLQANELSSSAQLLYHTLLMVNNKCGWMVHFRRTNRSLIGLIGIDEKTLIRARNELKQKGLIEFESGKKKGDITTYKLNQLINGVYTGNVPPNPPVEPPVEPPPNPPVEPPDIYKYKRKHKQKEDIYTPPKKKYADYVSMTEEEYQKLIAEYGEQKTKDMIEDLNNYKGSKGKKYKSDYLTIRAWIRKEEKELAKQAIDYKVAAKSKYGW